MILDVCSLRAFFAGVRRFTSWCGIDFHRVLSMFGICWRYFYLAGSAIKLLTPSACELVERAALFSGVQKNTPCHLFIPSVIFFAPSTGGKPEKLKTQIR